MQKFSYLSIGNTEYIDLLWQEYAKNPDAIDPTWRALFEGIEIGEGVPEEGAEIATGGVAATPEKVTAEIGVASLIMAYRVKGRFLANVDPLNAPLREHPELSLAHFGLNDSHLPQTFAAGAWIGKPGATLEEILRQLRSVYCGTTVVEWAHVQAPLERKWLQERIEGGALQTSLDAATQKFILSRLTETEAFERFLHTRYVAQKRFSVEGGDAILPAMDALLERGAELGLSEGVIGMAHRGRLNLLVNLMDKKVEHVFTQFEGHYPVDPKDGEGDVKYHMGYSHDRKLRSGASVHLSMANNPSHLEFVAAVVTGMARAKQEKRGDHTRKSVLPILIHGDAAFAGQGVNYEVLNFAQLEGYKVGGSIHFVINNQVGFTTSAHDARSSNYCTDLAKTLDAPVLHVNGDDPQAVWRAARLAIEYRMEFGKDFFIDLVCYRRHGHNEGDEPSYTQPLMYKKIKTHATPRDLFAQQLAGLGVMSTEQSAALLEARNQTLLAAQAVTKKDNPKPFVSSYAGAWKEFKRAETRDLFAPVKTAVTEARLKELAQKINTLPAGFQLHPKLVKFFEARLRAVTTGTGIDWGNGEALAYAALLQDGFSVRISGQDAERGTFTHRHAALSDFETGQKYIPHNAVASAQARFEVHNSHLSETGVMGFEFGYASSDPRTLVIWEAQFGDFANGAQVIIDQFLVAGESKWQRANGLVLLLPHGYEGQGAEHSSARLERFLQLCGRENSFVCNPTTPAQIFHVLRRQMLWSFRKPLVIPSPKSLLRHPQAISTLAEFSSGSFQEVIGDDSVPASGVKRVLLCSGKLFYELRQKRTDLGRNDVAIVRLEQLYPMPVEQIEKVLKLYPASAELVWVQEEPRNMGAWTHVSGYWTGALCDDGQVSLGKISGRELRYVGRRIASAPAVGSHHVHEHEQHELVEKAFS